jgi:DNA-binding NarL/FixJ family response regulator
MAIIQMIVEGKSNKEIGSEIHFTEGSIKNIISVILNKLQLRDRVQLAVYAVKNRIV